MQEKEGRTITLSDGSCECGLRPSPGEPDCATQRDLLLARDFEQPVLYWRYHRLAVDAYCLQHVDYIKSAKSFAAHLCGVCITLEHGNNQDSQRKLIEWLNMYPAIAKPEIPQSRGSLNIRHVSGITAPVEYGRAVTEWARSSWDAYREYQHVAREWVLQSQRLPVGKPRSSQRR